LTCRDEVLLRNLNVFEIQVYSLLFSIRLGRY
jgi:hypothetical protein